MGDFVVANIVEVLAITGWVGVLSALIFVPLRLVGLMRADDVTQDIGMDVAKHSPSKAYTIDAKEENTATRVSHQIHGNERGSPPQNTPPQNTPPPSTQDTPPKKPTAVLI